MILQRERVHALIDARLPGAVWLHGPTGAGKTVALRTYLERAGLAALWVTLDERHREPAALFASIGAAAASIATGVLPAFSPEHRDDPLSFARDYFTKLDDALSPEYALVVDDAHLADESTACFACALDVFSRGRPLFFASQLLPGPSFAAHLAGSRLWTIGHRLLAFDADEAVGLARRLGAQTPVVDALLRATDGWPAGLMLAMQLGPPSSGDPDDPLESLRSPLAHLIATQVLRGVAADDFRRLRVLADLPQVPMALVDVAEEWTSACAHLGRLADRGLFVERIAGERVRSTRSPAPDAGPARIARGSWRLHDLFRAAVREAGAARRADPVLSRELVDRLVVIDRLDLAWQLASSGDAGVFDALVDAHGSTALRDASLPLMREVTATSSTPGVAYWRTRALLGSDQVAALAAAEAAFTGFDASGDTPRKNRATSLAIFAAFAAIENVGKMAPWIERFKDVVREDGAGGSDPDEQAIRCAAEVMHDMHFGGRSDGRDIPAMQDRLLKHIVSVTLPPDELVLAGSLLVAAMQRANRVVEAEVAIVQIEALAAFALAAPHIRASWALESGYHHLRVGAPEAARLAFERCLSIAEDNALPQTRVGGLVGVVRMALASGDLPAARAAFERIDAVGVEATGARSALILHLRARIELESNEPQRALQSNDAASRLMREQGFPDGGIRLLDVSRMQILHVLGRDDEAEILAGALLETGSIDDRGRTKVTSDLLRAVRIWDVQREEAETLLRDSFREAERLNIANFVPLLPHVAAAAAAHALRLQVSVDFVRHAIRARRLPAPAGAPSLWPWPLRVCLLGTFAIQRDGVAMVFTGKAQQKPLELLKYLACERGMTADASALTSALWPDADGDGARKNLEVTVARLRKLVEHDTFVVVKEGRISLDGARVSSDARELIEVCTACEVAMAQPNDRGRAADLSARLLQLFVSLPLEHDEGIAWREGTRERYRSALVRAIRSLANALEASGESDRSIALIEAALAREPLAEGLYQSLMRAYIRGGENAEAMRVYRQCRQMLSILIGAAPSAETERLKDSIYPPGEKQ